VTVELFTDTFTISYKDAELKSKHDAWEEAQKAAAMQDKQKALHDL
jgi:hypothetical protein